MSRSRVIVLGLGVAVLSQTACSSSIPWPPRPGSCIEASRGKGKGAKWHYRLDDQPVSRETIERTLSAASPRWRDGVVSGDALSIAGAGVIIGGSLGYISSLAGALGTRRPQLLLLTVASVSMLIGGIVMIASAEKPFRTAIFEYNEAERQRGHCQRSEKPPLRTEHSNEPPAPAGLPTLPSGSWTP